MFVQYLFFNQLHYCDRCWMILLGFIQKWRILLVNLNHFRLDLFYLKQPGNHYSNWLIVKRVKSVENNIDLIYIYINLITVINRWRQISVHSSVCIIIQPRIRPFLKYLWFEVMFACVVVETKCKLLKAHMFLLCKDSDHHGENCISGSASM